MECLLLAAASTGHRISGLKADFYNNFLKPLLDG